LGADISRITVREGDVFQLETLGEVGDKGLAGSTDFFPPKRRKRAIEKFEWKFFLKSRVPGAGTKRDMWTNFFTALLA
jgi:hypothetical protein